MKKTAVEWLHIELMRINFEYATNKITPRDFQEQTKKTLEQANEMFKLQIIDSYEKVSMNTGEQYYNETFKNK